jgi:hypothetical protein
MKLPYATPINRVPELKIESIEGDSKDGNSLKLM